MKESSHINAYLQFLGFSRSVAELHGGKLLDANHTALLEAVALNWSHGQPLSVRQIIQQAHLGSPATLHKRLSRLVTNGFLSTKAVQDDHRTKWVKPTDKGLDYFHSLGKQMNKALNEEDKQLNAHYC